MAQLLREWLPKVIQRLNCFLSSHDIDAGSVWYDSLFRSLESSKVGILCLTSDSAQRPWLLFEAGVIAKSLTHQRVYPLLLELAPSDLPQPLAVFQGGSTAKSDMLKLVKMVNESAGDAALAERVLIESFETRWPGFEKDVADILKSKHVAHSAKIPEAPWQTAVQETLSLVRGIAAGSIPVSAKNPSFDARGERDDPTKARSILPPISSIARPPVSKIGNEAGRAMHQQLLSKVSEVRPLLANWVQAAADASMQGGLLCLYFDQSESHAADSLARDDKKKFLQGIVCELGGTGIEIKKLSKV